MKLHTTLNEVPQVTLRTKVRYDELRSYIEVTCEAKTVPEQRVFKAGVVLPGVNELGGGRGGEVAQRGSQSDVVFLSWYATRKARLCTLQT